MGSAAAHTKVDVPLAGSSVRSISRPFDTALSGAGTVTATRTVALSDGRSFTGIQVRAPMGCASTADEAPRSTQPPPSSSRRSGSCTAPPGVPEYGTTTVKVAPDSRGAAGVSTSVESPRRAAAGRPSIVTSPTSKPSRSSDSSSRSVRATAVSVIVASRWSVPAIVACTARS